MLDLYLVRHGETEENVAGILQGWLPGTLTARGREQARQLRDALRGRRFDAFYTSDLRRAAQTACILNEALHMPLQETPLLRERDWGSLTGRRIAEIDRRSFPSDVESVAHLFRRAATLRDRLLQQHDGGEVLAVSHGLFARALQACLRGVEIRDVPPLTNGQILHLRITPTTAPAAATLGETDATND